MRPTPSRLTGLIALLSPFAGVLAAEVLDLDEALRIADDSSSANAMAQARVEAASGRDLSAWAGFVPVVRAEAGIMATEEPLAAFGTRLGQRRVSMASFDPRLLNEPETMVGWNSALVAEIPLVNLDAWSGKSAANMAFRAEKISSQAQRLRTRAMVVDSWMTVLLARQAEATLKEALEVARAWESQAVSARSNEMSTRADLLRARVEAGNIEVSLSRARKDVVLAQRRLALVMGVEALPGEVPSAEISDALLAEGAKATVEEATSLEEKAMVAKVAAASANVDRTRLAFLPRLNGMARLDWKGRETPFEEDPSWTVGVQANWNLLRGLGDWGEERTSRGQWREASLGLVAMRRQEDLERAAARADLENLQEKLANSLRGVDQSAEAHRIAVARHREGMATLAERIEAGTLEMRTRLSVVAVRRELVATLANLAVLEGRDPARLADLVR
jgi:outer membrane protein TolC